MSARVAVVGGGVAGITAALACADRGADVTLVEVRPRLGGAIYSFERDGISVDNGQHVFLRCCTAYRALLSRLDSERHVELQDRLRIPVYAPGRPPALLRRSRLRAPLHLAGALARYPHLTPSQRARAALAARALQRLEPDDPRLDRRTLGSWLSEHGQDERAVAALWDLVALPTLNLRAAEASLALGAFVFQRGLLSEAPAADIGIHRAPLSEIVGVPALRALRQAGVDVRLRWRARSVTADGQLCVRGDDDIRADAVIVAVPHDRAAALLPPDVVTGASWPSGLTGSPIVNLHLLYDREVLDEPFAAGVDTPVQYVFDRRLSAPARNGQYVAVSLSDAHVEMGEDPDALRARYEPALAELLPRARDARVEWFMVTREHAATFRAAPGVQGLRPGARTPVHGLVLAGAWTQTGWPATLESAALSGSTAAHVALHSITSRAALAGAAA